MSARAPATDAADDVHMWRADLDRPAWPLHQLAGSLSPDERRRADAFLFPRDRRRFIAARGLLRLLLARYIGAEPSALRLRYGPQGKPELATPSGSPPVRFNYSRSQGRALYALTRGRHVGVDLEALRSIPEAQEIAEQWFTPRERTALRAVPRDRRDEVFLRVWTRKEAYVKALGDGLAGDLERIEMPLTAGDPPALRVVDGDARMADRWSLRALPTVDGYVAALVVEGHDYRLRCWSLPPIPALSWDASR